MGNAESNMTCQNNDHYVNNLESNGQVPLFYYKQS